MNVAFREPNESTPVLDAITEGLLLPSGIDGVYARTAVFENMVAGLGALISRHLEPGTEVLRFPPVMSRRQLEKSGYLKSFPHFLGCVSCLGGPEAEVRAAVDRFDAGEDWTSALSPADLVLSPAACYPVYPLVASRGEVPAEGLLFDVACDCFRREPSKDLDRLQSFRMRESVCVGSPEQINEFRRRWMTQAQALAGQLGLPWRIDHASDPFFGRGGKLMAASHDVAHTGCVAFGIDRLALALFATHGLNFARWPAAVRKARLDRRSPSRPRCCQTRETSVRVGPLVKVPDGSPLTCTQSNSQAGGQCLRSNGRQGRTAMQTVGLVISWAVAIGIIGIGIGYAAKSEMNATGFGLPQLPEREARGWWQVKGVRDIVSGILVIVAIIAARADLWRLILVLSLIPLGDALVVLTNDGRKSAAFGIHGATAAAMIIAALLLERS
jgi:hypothetical protein